MSSWWWVAAGWSVATLTAAWGVTLTWALRRTEETLADTEAELARTQRRERVLRRRARELELQRVWSEVTDPRGRNWRFWR